MKVHEYQAKELLRTFNVPTPTGKMATNEKQARSIAQELGGTLWVVKAQIHAGGRGKGGGVKLAKSLDEVEELSKTMIGMTLVTPQTGPEGKKVRKVIVESGSDIQKEYYVAILLDRSAEKLVVIASPEGGMDIEEVAAKTPEKVFKEYAETIEGFEPSKLTALGEKLGLSGNSLSQFEAVVTGLTTLFIEKDATMVEINPLIQTKEGDLLALDAKLNFDDNGLYRHEDIEKLRDWDEEDPKEVEASKFNLNYIALSGEIGCMVNGAGLAMATMDIIKLAGSEPANFLDVGGGATQEKVTEAFKLILSDPSVKAMLVNIFGGIMRCDVIARGILEAVKQIDMHVPLVVRLQGTNVEEGRRLLGESDITIITAETMQEAATKVVEAARA